MIEIEQNKSISKFTTFGVPIIAHYYTQFTSLEELKEIRNNPLFLSENKLILGGGSNVLFTKNFDGFVVKNEIKGIEVIEENENEIYLKSGAGENWHEFVLFCVDKGYGGVENLSLIPGNVGASPMQNIGAYGVEIKDVFHSLEAFHIETGELRVFNKPECEFGYRESVFKNQFKDQFIITSVTYKLSKKPVFNTSYGAIEKELENIGIKELSIKAISQAVINIRSSKLPNPAEIGNAGSFFKNPVISASLFETLIQKHPNMAHYPLENGDVKVAAGWLIDQLGWKGKRIGDIGVHKNQALVLVNYGGGTGKELYELSSKIIDSVNQEYSIKLEREVNIY